MIDRDNIIRMALETGMMVPTSRDHTERLERFAALVAEREREACAKMCEDAMEDFWGGDDQWNAARYCAEKIRARK